MSKSGVKKQEKTIEAWLKQVCYDLKSVRSIEAVGDSTTLLGLERGEIDDKK